MTVNTAISQLLEVEEVRGGSGTIFELLKYLAFFEKSLFFVK